MLFIKIYSCLCYWILRSTFLIIIFCALFCRTHQIQLKCWMFLNSFDGFSVVVVIAFIFPFLSMSHFLILTAKPVSLVGWWLSNITKHFQLYNLKMFFKNSENRLNANGCKLLREKTLLAKRIIGRAVAIDIEHWKTLLTESLFRLGCVALCMHSHQNAHPNIPLERCNGSCVCAVVIRCKIDRWSISYVICCTHSMQCTAKYDRHMNMTKLSGSFFSPFMCCVCNIPDIIRSIHFY